MKPLRPAIAAVILTALLTVPAHADHNRFGGFVFVEPFFVPVPEWPYRNRSRQQDGYPVALLRHRLRGIGFSRIGQFDVYPNSYGVFATDPGGVRVNLVIDRWSGDILRVREIEAEPAVQHNKRPAVVDRAPRATPKTAALRVPSLPRPAPERLTQTASVTPPATVQGGDIVTSGVNQPDAVPDIGTIDEPVPNPPPLAEAPPPEPETPVEIAAAPKLPAIAEADPVVGAATLSPTVATIPARSGTALQGERFDPADGRDPIADY